MNDGELEDVRLLKTGIRRQVSMDETVIQCNGLNVFKELTSYLRGRGHQIQSSYSLTFRLSQLTQL